MTEHTALTLVLGVLVAVLGLANKACDRSTQPAPAAAFVAETPPGTLVAETPSGPVAVELTDEPIEGEVAEVIDAGDYTYFRLTGADVWAVVRGAAPAPGNRIAARVFARRSDYPSPHLDRIFERIIFVHIGG